MFVRLAQFSDFKELEALYAAHRVSGVDLDKTRLKHAITRAVEADMCLMGFIGSEVVAGCAYEFVESTISDEMFCRVYLLYCRSHAAQFIREVEGFMARYTRANRVIISAPTFNDVGKFYKMLGYKAIETNYGKKL